MIVFLLVIFKIVIYTKTMLKKVEKNDRDYLVLWLIKNFSEGLSKEMQLIDRKLLPKKACALAKQAIDGKDIDDKQRQQIIKEADGAYRKKEAKQILEEKLTASSDTKAKAKPKKNIQEIMRQKAFDCEAELEEQWDDYLNTEIKATQKFPKFKEYMKLHSVLPQHVPLIKASWVDLRDELNGAINEECEQLVEGYSTYTKNQLKNMTKYCEALLADCDAYIEWKKASKAPRKKKLKTPAEMVKKLQYCESHDELKLKSVDPADIIRATQVWVYNIKNRKLQYYVADDGGFVVKGTTLSGFNTVQSQQKTLRKPADTLKKIKVASKDNAKMTFELLKTTGIACNGRFNNNLVIIKAS